MLDSLYVFLFNPWFELWFISALVWFSLSFFSINFSTKDLALKAFYQFVHFPLVGLWLPYTGLTLLENQLKSLPHLFKFISFSWSDSPLVFTLFLLLFLLQLDFIDYWIHRALHKFDFLFRFHTIHHLHKRLDWWTNLQFHSAEILIYKAIELPLLWFVWGDSIPLSAWIMVSFFRFNIGNYAHSTATSFSEKGLNLGAYINCPHVHLWHHALSPQGKNLGVTFTFWDRLFGSYYSPLNQKPKALGIKDLDELNSFAKEFFRPFKINAN